MPDGAMTLERPKIKGVLAEEVIAEITSAYEDHKDVSQKTFDKIFFEIRSATNKVIGYFGIRCNIILNTRSITTSKKANIIKCCSYDSDKRPSTTFDIDYVSCIVNAFTENHEGCWFKQKS